MATLAEAQQHQGAVGDLATLAIAELVAEFPSLLSSGDYQALRAELVDLLAAIMDSFVPASSVLAADFYEELRDQAGVGGTFVPDLADAPPLESLESLSGYGLSAETDEEFLARVAGGIQRRVANAARETMELNVDADPAGARFGRYASANACAFCALQAIRGPVYRSRDTAAAKYHDLCRCIAVPSWSREDFQEAPYVAEWREVYLDAAQTLGSGTNTKAILSQMRQASGLR